MSNTGSEPTIMAPAPSPKSAAPTRSYGLAALGGLNPMIVVSEVASKTRLPARTKLKFLLRRPR